MDIRGMSVLVTGGASGLGLATAEAMLQRGAYVVIADLKSSLGRDLADSLGDRAAFIGADVTEEEDVVDAVDLAAELGPFRVAVNCAGIGSSVPLLSDLGTFPLISFRKVIEVNLIGTFNVTRIAAERMSSGSAIDGEKGVIINTASIAAFDGLPGQAAYAASKGGVVSLTLPAARELAQRLIRVVGIAPGLFDTPLLGRLPTLERQELESRTPHPARLGCAKEYASLVDHIVSNPMINGEVIRLDGGLRMA